MTDHNYTQVFTDYITVGRFEWTPDTLMPRTYVSQGDLVTNHGPVYSDTHTPTATEAAITERQSARYRAINEHARRVSDEMLYRSTHLNSDAPLPETNEWGSAYCYCGSRSSKSPNEGWWVCDDCDGRISLREGGEPPIPTPSRTRGLIDFISNLGRNNDHASE